MVGNKKVAIIGAGAAGCFCAINLKRFLPQSEVALYEANDRALAKVVLTGGGRCNLTNTFNKVPSLSEVYPRGEKLLRNLFCSFNHKDTISWFEKEGVKLYAQEDERVFPCSQDSMEVVNKLLRLVKNEGIELHLSHKVSKITQNENGYSVSFHTPKDKEVSADYIVVTVGGFPKEEMFSIFSPLNLKIEKPLPSLFTFNIDNPWCEKLMGISVENVSISLAGTKFKSNGSLLFTHWGMSGPAILKLSSYASRFLAENNYKGIISINWYGGTKENEVRERIIDTMEKYSQKLVTNIYPNFLTAKHWQYFLEKSNIPLTQRWGALNKTHINRLVAFLTADQYQIVGKSHFKEEFVTCGGIALSNVNSKTLEAKEHPGLFFAGEILDIDAITGGFNLQAAWTTGFIVAQAIKRKTE